MVKMKKGLLFSFTLIFLALVILSLAILMFHNSLSTQERLSELGSFDVVYDLDSSLQKSLREIFLEEADIIVNVSNSSVAFEENLPNNESSFAGEMGSFKNFVEADDEHVWLDISDVLEELPLSVMPHNITYKHLSFGGDTIRIIPKEINFNALSIFARIEGNVTSCDFDTESGGLSLNVEIVGDYGTSCSNSMLVNPYEDSDIEINQNQFTIYIDDGIFDIISNKSTARVITKILFNATKNVNVGYPDALVHIDFSELKIAKRSHVRIK